MTDHNHIDSQTFELLMNKLESLEKQIEAGFGRVNGNISDHEKRLREGEQWRYKVIGGVALVAVLVPLLISIVGKILGL